MVVGPHLVHVITPLESTYSSITVTARRISIYIRRHDAWPPSLDALPQEAGKGYQTATDAWGNPLQYQISHDGIVTFTSFGKDGKPGGSQDDADISVSFYLEWDDGVPDLMYKDWRDAYSAPEKKRATDWLKTHATTVANVVFGGVRSNYTANQVIHWSITNNSKKDLRFYSTVEVGYSDIWRPVGYDIEDGGLSKEKKSVRLEPLGAGETKHLGWSIEKDYADRLKPALAISNRFRLKAVLYDADGKPGTSAGSVFSPEFEITPLPTSEP